MIVAMSIDYQVIAFQRPASVSQVGIHSLSPFTLEIKGSGMLDAVEVVINGTSITDFIVSSDSRMLVGIPSSLQYRPIETLVVLLSASSGSPGATSVLDFRSSIGGATASGTRKLVQNFVTLLLKTPGTDIFDTNGGGLLSLVGNVGDSFDLKAAVSVAVRTTAKQLTRMQSQEASLAANEKLANASLLSTSFDSRTSTLNVQIKLVASDGSAASVATSV